MLIGEVQKGVTRASRAFHTPNSIRFQLPMPFKAHKWLQNISYILFSRLIFVNTAT